MHTFFTKKRTIGFLINFVIVTCLLAWFINIVMPDTILYQCVFYILLGTAVFFLCMYVFADKLIALIAGLGTVFYFFLRFLHLRHPIYLLLVCLCCYSIYHVTATKKPPTHL